MTALVKRGMRFEHARFIDGSPKAGTAKPVVMVVSRVAGSRFWYKREDSPACKAGWVAAVDQIPSIVGAWL